MVALTCYGNAAVSGIPYPQFFPNNSTCQFCDEVVFVRSRSLLSIPLGEVVANASPNEWIAELARRSVNGLRLLHVPHGDRDRMLSAFVGGGGQWTVEVMCRDDRSEFWTAQWEVGNQDAEDRRIWKVKYRLAGQGKTNEESRRPLKAITASLRNCLRSIHAFSVSQECDGFSQCFAKALIALDGGERGYHKDLSAPGLLGRKEEAALHAAMCAWVFGGMGSWNDLGFDGATQDEYLRLSDELYCLLNEVIGVAASSGNKIPKR
jgi:hypothetical protein